MASWREIDRLRKDPTGFRTLAKALLAFEDLTEWEVGFLESIVRLIGVEEFSTRQGEKLLQIRDDAQDVVAFDGFSIETLIRRCYDARLDLSEDDEAWITATRERHAKTIKRKNAGKLMRMARQLGLIETAYA